MEKRILFNVGNMAVCYRSKCAYFYDNQQDCLHAQLLWFYILKQKNKRLLLTKQ
jgi:hypothetical protein